MKSITKPLCFPHWRKDVQRRELHSTSRVQFTGAHWLTLIFPEGERAMAELLVQSCCSSHRRTSCTSSLHNKTITLGCGKRELLVKGLCHKQWWGNKASIAIMSIHSLFLSYPFLFSDSRHSRKVNSSVQFSCCSSCIPKTLCFPITLCQLQLSYYDGCRWMSTFLCNPGPEILAS